MRSFCGLRTLRGSKQDEGAWSVITQRFLSCVPWICCHCQLLRFLLVLVCVHAYGFRSHLIITTHTSCMGEFSVLEAEFRLAEKLKAPLTRKALLVQAGFGIG